MENRIEIALGKHAKGYNCAQSVLCTFCDLLGMDEETAFRISEGFGAGMATMQGTCGALTGAYMVASLKNSNGLLSPGSTKADTYKLIREMADEFKEMNSSIICKELKGINDGVVKRSCSGCIEDAVKIVEKLVMNEK